MSASRRPLNPQDLPGFQSNTGAPRSNFMREFNELHVTIGYILRGRIRKAVELHSEWEMKQAPIGSTGQAWLGAAGRVRSGGALSNRP